MELRDKLVALLADLPNYFGDHWQATEAADAILAIPEIRNALESWREDQEWSRAVEEMDREFYGQRSLTHTPTKNT